MTATIMRGFSRSERSVVAAALQNVHTEVQNAIAGLRRAASSSFSPVSYIPNFSPRPRGTARDSLRLYDIFRVNATNSSSSNDISTIISKFNAADRFLDDQHTRIGRLTASMIAGYNARIRRHDPGRTVHSAPYFWGYAAVDLYNDGNSSAADLIYLGDAFFNPQPDDRIRRRVASCQGSVNLDLARFAILVHEAVHWINGTGGHQSLGYLLNPDNYGYFIMYTTCDQLFIVQSEVSTDRRWASRVEQSPGVAPMGGRLRRPGPIV